MPPESLGEEGRSLSFEPSKVLKAWNIDSRIVPSKVENVTESKGVCNSYGNFIARNFSIVCATSCGPLAASLGPISRREKCHLNEIEMEKERRKRKVITEGIEVFEGCSKGKSKIFSDFTRLLTRSLVEDRTPLLPFSFQPTALFHFQLVW